MTSPPPTRVEVVTDTLHGVTIDDPYRWLENGDDPEVVRWVADQNQHTRETLDARPDRERWHERLVALMGLPVVMGAVVRGERVFSYERLAGDDQFVLALRATADVDAEPTVLFDPAAGSADSTVAIDWFEPSDDGALVAFGISEGGTEDSTLWVLDVRPTLDTRGPVLLDEEIPHTRACSLSWEPDGSGFFYTRYPEGDEYHRTVHHHRLGGEWVEDPVVWDQHVTPETWPSVDVSPDGAHVLVHAMVGWSRHDVHLLDRSSGEWHDVIAGVDATSSFTFDGSGSNLLGTTTLDAPRGRIVSAPLDQPAEWTTVVDERPVVVGPPTIAGTEVLVVATERAVDRVERWSPRGELLGVADGLGIVSVVSLSADRRSGDAVAVTSGFEAPNRLFSLVESNTPTVATPGVPEMTVTQTSYMSADGTEIGMFLIHRSDVVPGPDTPTILNGYGGFAIAMPPMWSAAVTAWCERGGLYAVAGLRGGLEHGEEWHDAGRRANKQNVFDDFHAAADWLVESGRTTRERLAIDGRSNGGLLVGVALTQRPDLCRAVSCGVPLLDMIRFPQFLIARLWTDEYGDPDVAEEFGWLHAYSPYHHVVDGTDYPATFLWTAEGDSRVDPLHARKMAALLQAATADGGVVLLHQEGRAGHGVGKPVHKRADEGADVLSFVTWQLDAWSQESG